MTEAGFRPITALRAYDVRGRLGYDLDADIVWRLGRAFVQTLGAQRVVVGRDCRESSPGLLAALTRAVTESGADAIDLGLCGTEEVYHATGALGADGGIMITASHNPADYNGMKLVGPGAAPLDPEQALPAMLALAQDGVFAHAVPGAVLCPKDARADYTRSVVDMIDVTALRPMTVLVNAGNGAAGPTFDAIADALAQQGVPLTFVRLHHQPDGRFPNGIPNPLLPENQPLTAEAVRELGADFGVAWDGDFDRCFFFDETGRFVPGQYMVGLLAAAFLERAPGARIVHDPRVVLATRAMIAEGGGQAVQSRTGHAFMKQAMRDNHAIYGGEMSAHHYFREFYYCDSGMIPWLLVAELMSRRGASLGALVQDQLDAYPSSGEINFILTDPASAIERVVERFAGEGGHTDDLDGISRIFDDWRFNLRQSNTEPLVRLNVEAVGDAALVAAKVAEITALLRNQPID